MAHDISKGQRTGDVLLREDIDFAGLFLSNAVLEGLNDAGFRRPSPIQLKAIPIGRCGLDLIVQAKSGTGKTCVFSVIALEALDLESSRTQVLVLAPTREIAVQIHGVITTIGSSMPALSCHTFIGGMPVAEDKQKLTSCHVAVGTPGRLRQLVELGALKTDSIRLLVLDEADKLMEESFQEQINWLYSVLADNKQMVALSATYPEVLAQHLTTYMRNPTFVRLNSSDPALLGIRQYYSLVPYHPLPQKSFNHKVDSLQMLLSCVTFNQCLVFSNYQMRAQSLSDVLNAKGWPSTYISGSLDQTDRLSAMEKLKELQCRVLISTDLTARGIDAEHVNLVVNLDVPTDHETYLHRIGRAGRFGTYGAAVTLVCMGKEMEQLTRIEERCSTNIKPLPNPIPSDLAHSSGYVYLDDLVTTERIVTVDSTGAKHVPCVTPTPGVVNGDAKHVTTSHTTANDQNDSDSHVANNQHCNMIKDSDKIQGKPRIQYDPSCLKSLCRCDGCDKYKFMNLIDPTHSLYPHAVYKCSYNDSVSVGLDRGNIEGKNERQSCDNMKSVVNGQDGKDTSADDSLIETSVLNDKPELCDTSEAADQDPGAGNVGNGQGEEGTDQMATESGGRTTLKYDRETLKRIGQQPCSDCQKYNFCSVLYKHMGEATSGEPYYCAFRVMSTCSDNPKTQQSEEDNPKPSTETSSDPSVGAQPSLQYSRQVLLEIGRRPCSRCHVYHYHKQVSPVWGKNKKGRPARPVFPEVYHCAFAVGGAPPGGSVTEPSRHQVAQHPTMLTSTPTKPTKPSQAEHPASGKSQDERAVNARVAALLTMAPDLSWKPPLLSGTEDCPDVSMMRSRRFLSVSGSRTVTPLHSQSYQDMKEDHEAVMAKKHMVKKSTDTRNLDPEVVSRLNAEYGKEAKKLQNCVDTTIQSLHHSSLPSDLICVERQPSPERTRFRKQNLNPSEGKITHDYLGSEMEQKQPASGTELTCHISDASCKVENKTKSQNTGVPCLNKERQNTNPSSVYVQTDLTCENLHSILCAASSVKQREVRKRLGKASDSYKPEDPRGLVDVSAISECVDDSRWDYCDTDDLGPSLSSTAQDQTHTCILEPIETHDEYTYDDYDASYMYFHSSEDHVTHLPSENEMSSPSKITGTAKCDVATSGQKKICHKCNKTVKYEKTCEHLQELRENRDYLQTPSESEGPVDSTFAQSFQYIPNDDKSPRCPKHKKKKHKQNHLDHTDSAADTSRQRSPNSPYWPQSLPQLDWSNYYGNTAYWNSPFSTTNLDQYYCQQYWNHQQWAQYYKTLMKSAQVNHHIQKSYQTQNDYIRGMARAASHSTR